MQSFLVAGLGQIQAVLVDVLLVRNGLVFEPLLQVNALVASLRHTIDGVHHEVEAVRSFSSGLSYK